MSAASLSNEGLCKGVGRENVLYRNARKNKMGPLPVYPAGEKDWQAKWSDSFTRDPCRLDLQVNEIRQLGTVQHD